MPDLRFYLALFARRAPLMVALVILFSVAGAVTAVRLPPVYSSAARLLIEGPTIDDGLENRAIVTAGEQLQIIEQQLLTRANMLEIANKFDVFGERRLTPDEIVAQMLAMTTVRKQSGREQATLLTLGFTSDRARVASDVVNEYVTLILGASSRQRMARAEDALSFYEQEVARLGADLDKASATIIAFKSANADSLPENLRYSQDRQSLLQERATRIDADIAGLNQQRETITRQFETTGRIARDTQRPVSPEEGEVKRLEFQLQQLLSVYAPQSPRVRALEGQLAAARRAAASAGAAAPEEGIAAPIDANEALVQMTLSDIDTRIAGLTGELGRITAEMDAIAEAIRDTAANTIELDALERDRESIQARYNAALGSLNEARVSERLEASSRGQRITVIESATTPNRPSGPNRLKIAAMGIAAGMGLAAGLFVLLELLNRTIRRPSELIGRFNVTPIAVIPYMESRTDRRRRRIWTLATTGAVLMLLPIAMFAIHMRVMPLDELTQAVLRKLGLA